jgi:hypothetical protein
MNAGLVFPFGDAVMAQENDFIIGVVATGGLFFFLTVWVLAAYGAYAFRSWHETALKRDMVARGYSAKEILAVVSRKRRCQENESLPDVPPAKPVKQPAFG